MAVPGTGRYSIRRRGSSGASDDDGCQSESFSHLSNAIAGVSACSNIVAVVSTSTATCAVVSANTSAAVFKSLSDASEG